GVGGGKISIGADSLGEGLGWGIKGTLLHTWMNPLELPEDQDYLGLELELGYNHLYGSLGGYSRIQGDEGNSFAASASLGWKF
ncbi:MAG: hypothetical protein V2A34_03225, partial [Lentisphaerota bacterium]